MSNSWFRLYHEFATDPKVQTMSETFQRRFIMFLCMQCRGDFDRLSDCEKAYSLRISEAELVETIDAFKAKGFIDESGKISNWNKRQFVSDTSTVRVRKHRETKKKRLGNVSVTPPDTDTDTEKEQESAVAPPADLDIAAWDRWVTYRRKLKKPLNPVSHPAAQRHMAKLGLRQMEAVEHTEAQGWTGLRLPDAKAVVRERGLRL